MSNSVVHSLMLDLVEWLRPAPRSYEEAIEAWRTSCPRLTVWEDALEQGLVETRRGPSGSGMPASCSLWCCRRQSG